MYKLAVTIVCLTLLFSGVSFAQVSAESIVINEDSLGIGYVFDEYGASAIMALGPSMHEGVYNIYGFKNEWSLNTYVRYSFAGLDRADINELGGGIVLKVDILTIDIGDKDIAISLLGAMDFDLEENDVGDRDSRTTLGAMIDMPLVTWR